MTDGDKEKTAFATPRGGLYQFTTMLLGLCNAASTFERIVEKELRGLQCCASIIFLSRFIMVLKILGHLVF